MATARDFHHPFKPYDIQAQLMNAVYDCISEGKVGIFESPTGTGKSLSLICSTLSWLRDEQQKHLDLDLSVKGDDDEPAWIVEQSRKQRLELLMQQRLDLESRLAKIREKELRQKQQYETGGPVKKRARTSHGITSSALGDEEQFLLDDYESEDEARGLSTVQHHDEGFSAASLEMMRKLGEPTQAAQDDSELEAADELKVFFCSRTHSQLTQFVNELRRVKLPEAPWLQKEYLPGNVQQRGVVKHLPLGSRKNLCINPRVVNAGNTIAINERCLDLQQPSTPQEKKCPFLPNKENEALVNEFRDHTLARIRDIEDMGALGQKIGICPYYASRASIKPSEVVSQFPTDDNGVANL